MNNEKHVKYLITNEQDINWGLTINTAGHQNIEPGSKYPAGTHPMRYLFSTDKGRVLNEYQLIYITRGEGYFISSHQEKTEINTGSMILLFPGEWHTYQPDAEIGWYEYWIGFEGTNMDNRVAAGFFRKEKPVFNVGLHEMIMKCYKMAVQTAKEQKAGYQQMLAGIVNLLLGFTYSENKQMTFEEMKVTDQIDKAKVIMYENINKEISGEEIAKQVGMGYSWFRRIFKEYTGLAPSRYLQELKINKSKELLTNTQLSCQEIAYELGFETSSYFNTAFKKRTGITPSKYREFTQGRNREQ
ncbi:MAG: AraC family transcriptional regulator [Tannerellaceae bacterium]|nr:AraC family transcriptional regulator [Tannerellaceae bacterium]